MAITTYTIFDHTEVDEPRASGLPLEQAFAKVCEVAGFVPQFRRQDGVLILEFTDAKGIGREHAPLRKAHPIVVRARRELMQEAIDKGIWGIHAAADARWRAEMKATELPTTRAGAPILHNDLNERDFARATQRNGTIPVARLTEDGNVVPMIPGR